MHLTIQDISILIWVCLKLEKRNKILWFMIYLPTIIRVQNSFWFFFGSGFGFFLLSFLVPFALYLQQFGTRIYRFAWYLLHFGMVTILHFAWYLLHFGMVTLHFAWHLLHLAMFAFHSAWYLPRFGTSTSHLHGNCYILVLQTFMWVAWEFL